MRLAGFELYRYDLPLTAPLRLKGATLRRREGLLLKLIDENGGEGWGEASPLPGFSGESIDEAAGELRILIPTLLDLDVSLDRLGFAGGSDPGLDELRLSPSARFALELAACDLLARDSGRPLPYLLAPRPRAKIRVNALLSGSPEEVLAEAARLREAGYDAFKLKVGAQDVREEAALVRSLGESLGGATLRLDANRAWGFEEARAFVRAARSSRYEYVEEPLAQPGRMPDLVRETGLPVGLDESLVGMEPGALADHRYAAAVVLKPTLLGGLSAALRFAGEASRLGITPVVSSAYETGVGTAALVALAAAISDDAPAGLDTYRRLAADVVSPDLDLSSPVVEVRAACAPREVTGRYLEPFG